MTCEGERVLGKRFDPPCFLGVQVRIGGFDHIAKVAPGLYAATPQLSANWYSRCSHSSVQ